MREIDLIPREHSQRRQLRRALKRAAVLVVSLIVATATARLALAFSIARQRPLVEQRHHTEQAVGAARARIAELVQQKTAVETRLGTLKRLQQGAGWEAALQNVDRAFGKGLWIDQLTLTSAAASATQRVDIKGHAVDHAAVTAFTRALREQPSVQDVRLVDTGLRRYTTTQVVDFTLAATRVAASGAER